MPLDVLRRLLTPLREPIVTSRYPDAPPLLQLATRGLPEVDPVRCERAGACVTACPTGAIVLRDASWEVDAGRCVFCSACALACPHDAIRLGSRIELAGHARADLVIVTRLEARG
jgi:formate hydrogenlyase subunit 6/NADH:ubiquinone oxidoreductase subunit I